MKRLLLNAARIGIISIVIFSTLVTPGCVRNYPPDPVDIRERHSLHDVTEIYSNVELPSYPLTAQDAVSVALQRNLDLQVKEREIAIQSEVALQEKLKMFPSLTPEFERSGRDENTARRTVPFGPGAVGVSTPGISEDTRRRIFDINLVWSLLDFGLSYYRAKAEANRAITLQLELERLRQKLVVDVVRAYWTAFVAKKAMKVTQAMVDKARERQAKVSGEAEDRIISKLDSLRRMDTLVNAKIQLQGFEWEYNVAKVELAALMGLPPCMDFEITDDDIVPPNLELCDVCELEEVAMMNRPELYARDVEGRVAAYEARVALLQLFPNAVLFAGHHWNKDVFLIFHHWNTLGMRLSWDLLSIPQRTKGRMVAIQRQGLVHDTRLAVSLGVMAQVHLAYLSYYDKRSRYELAAEYAEVKKGIFDVARRAYVEGGLDYDSLLSLELDATYAEVEALRAYRDLQTSLEQVNYAIGIPFFYNYMSLCAPTPSEDEEEKEKVEEPTVEKAPELPPLDLILEPLPAPPFFTPEQTFEWLQKAKERPEPTRDYEPPAPIDVLVPEEEAKPQPSDTPVMWKEAPESSEQPSTIRQEGFSPPSRAAEQLDKINEKRIVDPVSKETEFLNLTTREAIEKLWARWKVLFHTHDAEEDEIAQSEEAKVDASQRSDGFSPAESTGKRIPKRVISKPLLDREEQPQTQSKDALEELWQDWQARQNPKDTQVEESAPAVIIEAKPAEHLPERPPTVRKEGFSSRNETGRHFSKDRPAHVIDIEEFSPVPHPPVVKEVPIVVESCPEISQQTQPALAPLSELPAIVEEPKNCEGFSSSSATARHLEKKKERPKAPVIEPKEEKENALPVQEERPPETPQHAEPIITPQPIPEAIPKAKSQPIKLDRHGFSPAQKVATRLEKPLPTPVVETPVVETPVEIVEVPSAVIEEPKNCEGFSSSSATARHLEKKKGRPKASVIEPKDEKEKALPVQEERRLEIPHQAEPIITPQPIPEAIPEAKSKPIKVDRHGFSPAQKVATRLEKKKQLQMALPPKPLPTPVVETPVEVVEVPPVVVEEPKNCEGFSSSSGTARHLEKKKERSKAPAIEPREEKEKALPLEEERRPEISQQAEPILTPQPVPEVILEAKSKPIKLDRHGFSPAQKVATRLEKKKQRQMALAPKPLPMPVVETPAEVVEVPPSVVEEPKNCEGFSSSSATARYLEKKKERSKAPAIEPKDEEEKALPVQEERRPEIPQQAEPILTPQQPVPEVIPEAKSKPIKLDRHGFSPAQKVAIQLEKKKQRQMVLSPKPLPTPVVETPVEIVEVPPVVVEESKKNEGFSSSSATARYLEKKKERPKAPTIEPRDEKEKALPVQEERRPEIPQQAEPILTPQPVPEVIPEAKSKPIKLDRHGFSPAQKVATRLEKQRQHLRSAIVESEDDEEREHP